MFARIKTLVRNEIRLLTLNSLFCGSLLVFQLCQVGFSPQQFSRALGWSALVFILLLLAARLFRDLFREQLVFEFVEHVESEHFELIKPFVLVRECFKVVVGVALCLGWLAGLLLICEAGIFPLVGTALLGAAFSVLALASMSVFLLLAGRIRLP